MTTLPNDNAIEPKAKHSIPVGVVLYSPITDIYYKMIKGVLYKYRTYGGAQRGWVESMYSMGFKHMKKATPREIKALK